MTRSFVFGSDMGAVVDGQRAVLDDHAWMWSDEGRAVAAPADGRQVHGVVWDGPPTGPGHVAVTVVTPTGQRIEASALVVAEVDPGPPDPVVLGRVVAAARHHGLPDEWITYLTAWSRAGRTIVDPEADGADGPATLTDLLAAPGVVEECELRSAFGFMAIHGGDLEVATDLIASLAAQQAGASYYGVRHPVGFTSHLASTSFDPVESPALRGFLGHVDVVVSIHGYGRRGQWRSLLLGGRNRPLAEHVAATLREVLPEYDLVTDLDLIPPELRGLNDRNPVNLAAHGGVQIELPPRVRGLSPMSPPAGGDGLSPPTRALVDGLARAAALWSASTEASTSDALPISTLD